MDKMTEKQRGFSSINIGNIVKSQYVTVMAIAIGAIVVGVIQPRFLSYSNMQNISRQASTLAVFSIGQMFPILTAGLDLSQGGIVAVVSVLAAIFANEFGILLGFFMALIASGILGLITGVLISIFEISPFIVTLGMLSIAKGMALFITNGQPIFEVPENFSFLGVGYIGPFSTLVIMAAIVFFIAYIILAKTTFGRYIYAIGGNPEAARLSGIKVFWVRVSAYVICGLVTGLGAIMLTSRVNTGQPNLGEGIALQAIAAVVIGGVSLFGGIGKVSGVLLGVLVISLLSNALNLLNVSSYIQLMAIGCVIVAAVVVDKLRHD